MLLMREILEKWNWPEYIFTAVTFVWSRKAMKNREIIFDCLILAILHLDGMTD